MNEKELNENILKALINIQNNKIYYGKKENVINDGLRDMLRMVFECSDQTRQGESETGVDSGQVDILIRENGIPRSVIEAIRLTYLDKENIKSHINKAVYNYDANGCKVINIVIYAMMARFADFWNKFYSFLNETDYPYEINGEIEEIDTDFAESRHAKVILSREEYPISLHFYVIHLREENKEEREDTHTSADNCIGNNNSKDEKKDIIISEIKEIIKEDKESTVNQNMEKVIDWVADFCKKAEDY